MKYFEQEFDEVLMSHNPKGGRPMQIGGSVWVDKECVDITQVREDVVRRFMLGYCPCGRKVVIGYKRAEYLAGMLRRNNIEPHTLKEDVRIRLARFLITGSSVNQSLT